MCKLQVRRADLIRVNIATLSNRVVMTKDLCQRGLMAWGDWTTEKLGDFFVLPHTEGSLSLVLRIRLGQGVSILSTVESTTL